MKNLAERFFKAREMAKITQANLADATGVLQQSINKIEQGIIKNPKKIEKYAKALNVSAEWLMFGSLKHAPFWAITNKHTVPDGYIPILKWDEIKEWTENGTNNLNMDASSRAFIKNPIEVAHERIFSVKINSDSMIPNTSQEVNFLKGSVVVASYLEKCNSDDYVIVKKQNEKEAYLRQIAKEGDRLFIKPLNSIYPFQLLDENYLILGVVLCKIDFLL